ncbi:MAG: YbaN family protein [Lachnospiraceae bacterium]
MNLKQLIYLVVGILALTLGSIGALIPLLPTVPFLLLAAFCFGKSSKRLELWFHSTRLYKNNLEGFVRGEGMTMKTKLRIVITVTLLLGFGFIMMSAVPIARAVVVLVWVAHMWYFLVRVRTAQA